jgi:hypothetical protein
MPPTTRAGDATIDCAGPWRNDVPPVRDEAACRRQPAGGPEVTVPVAMRAVKEG